MMMMMMMMMMMIFSRDFIQRSLHAGT